MPTSDEVADLARRYADAWSARDREAVLDFFAPEGRTRVNGGPPATGRSETGAIIDGFMESFPDLVIRVEDIRHAGRRAIFGWRLEGTNSGPGGTGARVSLRGWEEWNLTEDLRFAEVSGWFDESDYRRQLAAGAG